MPLKTLVKVGNITNLSDARYCAGMGVEMLGFNVVEGTPGYITSKSFQEIRGWLSGPLVVAELYSIAADALDGILENYHPDFFELSLNELGVISDSNTDIILSVNECSFDSHQHLIQRWKERIRYLIISQTGYNNNFADRLKMEFDVLVAVNDRTDVHALTEDPKVKGIALFGGQEIRPGLKDFDTLASVLEQLDVD